jgi:hypothetical protein
MQSNPIIIDFNEASREWNKNKKKTPEGYKYICKATIGKTKRHCKTVCFKTSEYCYIHRKQDERSSKLL